MSDKIGLWDTSTPRGYIDPTVNLTPGTWNISILTELQNSMIQQMKNYHFPEPILSPVESLRAALDKYPDDEARWNAYIDCCLEQNKPVLMTSFECAAGWGAIAIQAGATLGLWKQEPQEIIPGYYGWWPDDVKTADYFICQDISEVQDGFSSVDAAKRFLIEEMNCHALTPG